MNPKPTYGYVFTRDNLLRGSDDVPLVLGKIYHKRMTLIKEIWFHDHLFKAFRDASGTILCKYQILSPVRVIPYFKGDDSYYTDRVKLVAFRDVSRTLHKLSLYVATAALLQCPGKNKVLWGAIEMKWAWLEGRASDDELRAYWRKLIEYDAKMKEWSMRLALEEGLSAHRLVDIKDAVVATNSMIHHSVFSMCCKETANITDHLHLICFEGVEKEIYEEIDELLTDML